MSHLVSDIGYPRPPPTLFLSWSIWMEVYRFMNLFKELAFGFIDFSLLFFCFMFHWFPLWSSISFLPLEFNLLLFLLSWGGDWSQRFGICLFSHTGISATTFPPSAALDTSRNLWCVFLFPSVRFLLWTLVIWIYAIYFPNIWAFLS